MGGGAHLQDAPVRPYGPRGGLCGLLQFSIRGTGRRPSPPPPQGEYHGTVPLPVARAYHSMGADPASGDPHARSPAASPGRCWGRRLMQQATLPAEGLGGHTAGVGINRSRHGPVAFRGANLREKKKQELLEGVQRGRRPMASAETLRTRGGPGASGSREGAGPEPPPWQTD